MLKQMSKRPVTYREIPVISPWPLQKGFGWAEKRKGLYQGGRGLVSDIKKYFLNESDKK